MRGLGSIAAISAFSSALETAKQHRVACQVGRLNMLSSSFETRHVTYPVVTSASQSQIM